MKNYNILAVLCALSYNHVCSAGYDIDILIGDTNNTPPLKTSIKLSAIPEERNLPEKIVDTEGFVTYERPKINQIISPGHYLDLKIQSPDEPIVDLIDLNEYASFSGQTAIERSKNNKWHAIFFEALNNKSEWEVVPLYWGYTEKSILVFGESENFVFSAFQRSLPKFDKKTKNYKQTLEISLIKKHVL